MSGTWSAHISDVNRLIEENKAKRAARLGTATTARNAAAASAAQSSAVAPSPVGATDQYYGGANTADAFGSTTPATGNWGGGFPNASTIASFLDVNPNVARAGLTALGLVNPALGTALAGMGLIGNAANTSNNVGMLSGLGVNPGIGSVLGGLLGFNGLSGNNTAALNAAMANQYEGFANLSPNQMPGDVSGTSYAGSMADIAGQMDAANAAAQAASTPSSPSGGWGDLGDISSTELFQKGGYTGAGRDGKVQPYKPAGIVHEGEIVIPHHVVKRLGLLG